MKAARLTLLAVAACLLCNSSCFALAVPSSSRIWGGEDVNSGDSASVASVRVKNTHACGGNIITSKHILTAGHCVSELSTIPISTDLVTVRVGSVNQYAGGELCKVSRIDILPGYANFLNNIAILTLANPLTLTPGGKIDAIALATAEDDAVEGDTVTLDGWGLDHDNQSPYKLQHLESTVIGRAECEYQAGYGYEQVYCLSSPERKGICTGDAGAGVISNKKLVGVASFAFGACGTNYPDVATKVSYFSNWINGIIA